MKNPKFNCRSHKTSVDHEENLWKSSSNVSKIADCMPSHLLNSMPNFKPVLKTSPNYSSDNSINQNSTFLHSSTSISRSFMSPLSISNANEVQRAKIHK